MSHANRNFKLWNAAPPTRSPLTEYAEALRAAAAIGDLTPARRRMQRTVTVIASRPDVPVYRVRRMARERRVKLAARLIRKITVNRVIAGIKAL